VPHLQAVEQEYKKTPVTDKRIKVNSFFIEISLSGVILLQFFSISPVLNPQGR
jgi:hypothetical protein